VSSEPPPAPEAVPDAGEPEFVTETRHGYDTIAEDYLGFREGMHAYPLDRGLLAVFAELVRAGDPGGAGPVVEVGCGPGLVTAHLAALGLDASGVDLSPAMVEIARRDHPELRFTVGDMRALDLPDGGLAGLVAHYSIIHVPDDGLAGVFAEFRRVLAAGGWLFLAFQVGADVAHHTGGFGKAFSLRFRRLDPDAVAARLGDAGFSVWARTVRAADRPSERTPQGYLLARAPG
jgi:SAM-dependent methyltransferase